MKHTFFSGSAKNKHPTTIINNPILPIYPMARQNKITLPSGMGGLTRYFDDYTSNVELKPGHVVILSIVVIVLIIILHIQGNSWLGLS